MIQNPQSIVENKYVEGTISVQPNAIDFTIDDLHEIIPSFAYLSNDKSKVVHKKRIPVELTDSMEVQQQYRYTDRKLERNKEIGWLLKPNTQYDGTSSVYVKVPSGMCAFITGRSTFNRNAIVLTSGLYDSGFEGNIGFILHNKNGNVFLEKGTMVGQIWFIKAEDAHLYAGGYNTQPGQHWTDAVTTAIELSSPVIETPIEPETPLVAESIIKPVEEATVVDNVIEPIKEVVEATVEPIIDTPIDVVEPVSEPTDIQTEKSVPKRRR